MQDFQGAKVANPAAKCAALADNVCLTFDRPDPRDGTPQDFNTPKISLCENMYKLINKYIDEYEDKIKNHCSSIQAALDACEKKPNNKDALECQETVLQNTASKEDAQSELLKANQRRFWKFEVLDKIDKAREKFERDKAELANMDPMNSPRRDCGKNSKNNDVPDYWDKLKPNGGNPGEIFQELSNLRDSVDKFLKSAFSTATKHETRSKDYTKRAQDVNRIAQRLASAGPQQPQPDSKKQDNNKSDITGRSPTSAPAAAKGGGSPGGGSPGGGSGGSQGGSGPTAGTPDSHNTGDSLTGNKKSDKDNGLNSPTAKGNDNGSSKPAKADGPEPGTPAHLGGGFSFGPGSVNGANSITRSNDGSGSSGGHGAKAASAGAGGGGGGSGGGGELGKKKCVTGPDCGAYDSASNSFGGRGALGGGGGGGGGGLGSLDGLDAGGSLDSLFKKDDKGAPGAGLDGLGALAGPDGGAGGLDGLGANGDTQAAASGIEGANGGDLFERVRGVHERAQKRGMIVGLTKKL